MNADKEGGLGPILIFTALVILGTIVAIVYEVRSRAPVGETCRMMLPAAFYETPEAAAAARFRGNIRPALMDPEIAESLTSLIASIARSRPNDDLPALENGSIRERLRSAASTVIAMEEPPCAWRWSDIRDTISRFGNDIPIAVPPWSEREQFASIPMAFTGTPPTLIVNPDLVGGMSDGEIASILVHEATHDVFETLAMETSGLDHKQIRTAQILCGAFDLQMTHIHEGLATWNELRSYTGLKIDAKTREDIGDETIKAIDAYDHGRPKAFIDVTLRNLALRVQFFDTGNGRLPGCGYPPIFEGRNAGRAFIPNGIDDQLVNAFGLATRMFL